MGKEDPRLATINASGFPLQIAIENLVRSTEPGGWKVEYAEHAWLNEADGIGGYADIVLTNSVIRLVIECKRVKDTSWLFARQDGQATDRRHVKAWASFRVEREWKHFGWFDCVADPPLPEATYFSVRGHAGEQIPMLERYAATLISATEAIAIEHRNFRDPSYDLKIFIPIIVTTAELCICLFDPATIAPEEGVIPSGTFSTVPYLRFRKQLSRRPIELKPSDYRKGLNVAYEKERTVFVVNSASLTRFLRELELDDAQLRAQFGI